MMTVSLCVVAYNEEQFLPNLLSDLQKQTYPHELTEIILVDGNSQDRTKEIMHHFAKQNLGEFSRVQVLSNPKRIQAAGWNVAITHAEKDVIVRIDAHTHIPPEFITLNIRNLESGENISGGVRPCLIENRSRWSKLLLETENSMFGSSIGKSRHSQKKEYVKTFFHAAYRKEVFENVGLFNENLLRTEDNEMHYRMRKAGYRFAFDPSIVSYQFARSNLRKMIKQKYGNGYWIGLTLGVCPGCISIYHLVPFVFVLAIVFTSALILAQIYFPAIVMWTLYLLFGLLGMVSSWIKNGFDILFLLMPFLFLILHISYGMGTFIGLVRIPKFKKQVS